MNETIEKRNLIRDHSVLHILCGFFFRFFQNICRNNQIASITVIVH